MTIKISCGICGKNYKVQDEAAGKKLRCKECGETIKIPEPEVEFGDGDDFSKLLDDAVEEEAKARTIRRPVRKPMVKAEKYDGDEDGPVTAKKENNYTQDLVQTFLFLLDPGNLFTFVLICMLLFAKDIILPFAAILGLIGQLIILGWYSNYRFSVIYESATGRKELPELSPEEGFFFPMLQWIATWFMVHFPAMLFLAYALNFEGFLLLKIFMVGVDHEALTDLLTGGQIAILISLYSAGLFFWPILALCVAVGGFETVLRIDLMLLTILKSFAAYFFTAGAMFVSTVVYFFTAYIAAQHGIVIVIFMIPILLYLEIVALRMIGLYYHHFKKQFAWHWG
ncbi:hypothetical protein [Gimesia maris]|jgi:hypothetical protein|uniref:hypothetical protein n=1 Tax=Gimesia maris TaxID=122 RepID=UPI000E91EE20|nr:hypothetical protein [Gimesia maris]HAW32475.1 hypothetical protein [Planctomycetaceae bacterium]|tara:strand:+ start:15283 stop:16302 length:1020 start_codon:yes stop_codon:yes gene_type:complete